MSAKFIVAIAYVIEKNGSVLMLRRSPLKAIPLLRENGAAAAVANIARSVRGR